VGGPFDRVGVDVIQFPQSSSGNLYAVVFMDYLTKWPEVYTVSDHAFGFNNCHSVGGTDHE
jgi:hypothetical protein